MNYSKLYLLLLGFLFVKNACAQPTGTQNYILTRTYKQSGAATGDVSKVATQVQYFDGLGRPSQVVDVGQCPSGADLVGASGYDALGRPSKKHLQYPAAGSGAYQSNAAAGAAGFYQSAPVGLDVSDLGQPFQQDFYEKSPLDRVTGRQAPGNKSAPSIAKHKVNAASQVKRYDFDLATSTLSQVGHYAAGNLLWLNETGEAGNVTNVFTDKQGQMVCRQVVASAQQTLSTYYVYDDLGLLRAVLQPGYQDNPSISDHAFTYSYDERGRNITKNIPGAGTTELVYDRFNRPAMSRDASQAARGVWGFTKYDGRNRAIAVGEIASALNRADWAAAVDVNTLHHEERSNGQTAGYTLDKTAPKNATEAHLLAITFYDDYAFSKGANLAFSPVYYPASNANVKGYPTGSRARILPGAGGTGAWLTTVNYYDAEYRPVQINRDLHGPGAGATERVSNQYLYDLAPVIAVQKTEQLLAGNITNTHVATHTYDHADRLLSTHERVTTNTDFHEAYTIARRYNAIGQVHSQWLHSTDASRYLRKTTYTHNIRSLQTAAKTVYKKEDNGPELPFFGYGLAYLKGNTYTNGNISQMDCQDKAQGAKGLAFTYDGANRLTGSVGTNGYTDSEHSITYDANGNLKTLTRAGAAQDQLTYAYSGNRLTSVTDNSGNNTGQKSGLSSYAYDAGGNMTTDGGRNATISYNPLGLAKTVKIGGQTFTYDYDGSGRKLQYVADTITLQYAGIFEYRKTGNVSSLYQVRLAAGQAVIAAGKPAFHYVLKDHLGNNRVVFNEKGVILQRTDYYPFGLEIDRNSPIQPQNVRNGINRYNFLGKETQVATGYIDLQARFYDPTIGRFMQVDPLADKMPSWSPYSYGFNNPIRFIDPLGLAPSTHTDEEGNVLAVYNDGDMGVYMHGNNADGEAPTKSNIDQRHEQSTSAGGERIGETAHWDEFITPGTNRAEGTIHFGENQSWDPLVKWGNDRANNQDLTITMKESKLNQVLDIKNNKDWASEGPMTGRLLNGKYATARSAGNYLAGMNGVTGKFQGSHISGDTYMKLAGAYQVGQLSMANILKIITYGASFGPAPYYGEEPYSGRRILEGINAGNKLLKK